MQIPALQCAGVRKTQCELVLIQLVILQGHNIRDRVPHAKAGDQQGRASGNAHHRHEETLFVPEQVSSRDLAGELQPAPHRRDVLQKNPLAGLGGLRQHQLSGHLPHFRGAGPQRHRQGTQNHGQRGHQGEGDVKGRQNLRHVIHDVVGVNDDIGEQPAAYCQTDDAARNAGNGGVNQVFGGDFRCGVAQGLQGAHLLALLLHHAGHGGQGHQSRHQEEEQGEHRGNGGNLVGVGVIAGKAGVVGPGVDVPLAFFNFSDFAFRVCQFLLRVGKLLLGLRVALVVVSPAAFKLLTALLQLHKSLVVLGLGVVQLGLSAGEFRLSCLDALLELGRAGVQLSLAVVQSHLLILQGLSLGVQLLLIGVQLGLACLPLGQPLLVLGVAFLPGCQSGGGVRSLSGQGVQPFLQGGKLLSRFGSRLLQLGDQGQCPRVGGVAGRDSQGLRCLEQSRFSLG